MTPERELLEKALELAPQQRPALLDRTCGADPSLRGQVEDLLASSDHVPLQLFAGSATARYAQIAGVPGQESGPGYRAQAVAIGRVGSGPAHLVKAGGLAHSQEPKLLIYQAFIEEESSQASGTAGP